MDEEGLDRLLWHTMRLRDAIARGEGTPEMEEELNYYESVINCIYCI